MQICNYYFKSKRYHEYLCKHIKEIQESNFHDNETAIQWYNNISNHNEKEVYEQQKHINRILNMDTIDINWSMISFCMHSKALIVIFPIQDLLGLDAEGRMNIPGTVGDQNWTWRMESGLLDERVIKKMSNLTKETLRE